MHGHAVLYRMRSPIVRLTASRRRQRPQHVAGASGLLLNPDYSSVRLRSRVWQVTCWCWCWCWCWNCRIAQSLKLDALVEDEADGTSVSVQLRGPTNDRPSMQCGTVLITGWSPHDRSRFIVRITTTVTVLQNSAQLDDATLPKTVSDTTGG